MPPPNRKTIAEKLITIVSKEAWKTPDFRKRINEDTIPLHDAIMSGLAVMHLKYPSLLQFDRDCVKKPDKLRNLKSLYRVGQVPCDTNLREMLDPIETRYFRKFFTLMVAKDTSNVSLYESVDELDKAGKVKRYCFTDEKGCQHWFRFVNDVPINKSHKETLVNYLEYVETDPKGKKYVNTWITDIQLTQENVAKVMRGGRAKWKIERSFQTGDLGSFIAGGNTKGRRLWRCP